MSLVLVEIHHFWRRTPRINNLGFIDMGSTLPLLTDNTPKRHIMAGFHSFVQLTEFKDNGNFLRNVAFPKGEAYLAANPA